MQKAPNQTKHRAVAILTAVALAVPLGASFAPTAEASPTATTSPKEAQRVDQIPAPELNWQGCSGPEDSLLCADVLLPLDYDEPDGKQITVSVLKYSARDPQQRIGTLFINPGGPGGSGKELAAAAEKVFGAEVLDKFDIVGMDPRGVGDSTSFSCFPTGREGFAALQDMLLVDFPTTAAETDAYLASSRKFSEACSTYGSEMASAVSTAQVARDMEVLRRAMGDEPLNYLGFSYGSYLGQVYAGMFPDRIRSLAIDGVLNPTEWLGTFRTASLPFAIRTDSGGGADYALTTLFDLCAESDECVLEDPHAAAQRVFERLRLEPVEFPAEDGSIEQVTYARFMGILLRALYSPDSVEDVIELFHVVEVLGEPAELTERELMQYGHRFLAVEEQVEAAAEESPTDVQTPVAEESVADLEEQLLNAMISEQSLFSSVVCSEGAHPSERTFVRRADDYSAYSPYFGATWYWFGSVCSTGWTARDEDSFRGPFNQQTSAPILVVGNEFDPATNMWNALEVAAMLPNSRLVLSNNWGHLAYGASPCATRAIESYLINPVDGEAITCTDGAQPFAN